MVPSQVKLLGVCKVQHHLCREFELHSGAKTVSLFSLINTYITYLFPGTWVTFGSGISEEIAEGIIVAAYEAGVNLFDVSEAHSGIKAELELGRILHRKNWKRSSFIVATKIYWNSK